MARYIKVVEAEIEDVKVEIKDTQSQVSEAQSGVVQTETALSEVTAQVESPSLSEESKAKLRRQEQLLSEQLLHRRTELQQLRRKEEQLRTMEEQLRAELRERLQQGPNDRLGVPTLNKGATAMMALLRSLTQLPATGEVLRFGQLGLLLDPKYSCVYIRACYEALFEVLITSEDNTITGTPGTGKSCFLYYLLARLLALPEPPPYILWEHSTAPGEMWCYDSASREVRLGNRLSFDCQLANPKAWYISDGIPPHLPARARIVLITLPRRSVYKEMENSGATTLYMPLWSLEELLDCRVKVYDGSVPEDLATLLYEHYGGDARYVLGVPSLRAGSPPLDALLQPLTQALGVSSTAQVRAGVVALETGPEVSHRVLHLVVEDDFELPHLDFASRWVADEFVARAMRADLTGLVAMVAGTEGAVRGHVYEQLAHRLLAQGGEFTVMPIARTLARTGAVELLRLDSRILRRFRDVEEISAAGFPEDVYYRPVQPNFEAVDSLLRVGKTLCLFQMTAGCSRKVNAGALSRLLEGLGPAVEELELRFYYVVPPDIFKDFKLRADAELSLLDESQAARTRLYVLEGDVKALLRPQQQQQTGGSRKRPATTAAVMAPATRSTAATSAHRPPEVLGRL